MALARFEDADYLRAWSRCLRVYNAAFAIPRLPSRRYRRAARLRARGPRRLSRNLPVLGAAALAHCRLAVGAVWGLPAWPRRLRAPDPPVHPAFFPPPPPTAPLSVPPLPLSPPP